MTRSSLEHCEREWTKLEDMVDGRFVPRHVYTRVVLHYSSGAGDDQCWDVDIAVTKIRGRD